MTANTNTERQRAERVGRRLQMSGLLYKNDENTVALIVRIIEQEMIPALTPPTASGWIAVSERLPEESGVVMVGGWNKAGLCAWRAMSMYDGGDNKTWSAFRGSAGEDIYPEYWWDGPLPDSPRRDTIFTGVEAMKQADPARAFYSWLAIMAGVAVMSQFALFVLAAEKMPIVSSARVWYVLGGLFLLNQLGWFLLHRKNTSSTRSQP